MLIELPYFVLPAGAQATVQALHERNVRVRVLTNSLASNDVLPAHSGYAKTRKQLLESGMELYELRPDTDAFRPGWSLLSKGSRAALHNKAMVFDREAVFIGSFNLDPRSAWINTEAGLYIESPELAERLVGRESLSANREDAPHSLWPEAGCSATARGSSPHSVAPSSDAVAIRAPCAFR